MTAPLLAGGGQACRRVEQAFLACIADNGMAPLLQGGVLLAFSGGQDSMLLLALMQAYTAAHGIPLAAAHVHHGIRGETAERDALFCQQITRERGIPFFLAREDAPAFAKGEGRGRGEEAAAREVRYRALERLMRENPAYRVTVSAHHATDNMETVLLNLLRGSGVHGMCGIPPVRGRFLRPLLYVPRRDIAAAVCELSLPYVTDETNEAEVYDRNYIRAHILPHLAHLRGDPEAAFTRLCLNMREEKEPADLAAEEFYKSRVKQQRLPRAALLTLPRAVAYRVLNRLFAACGAIVRPERAHLVALLDLLATGPATGQCPMPGGYCAEFDQEYLTFLPKTESFCAPYDILLQMGKNELGESGGILWLFSERNVEFEKSATNVYNLFIQAKLDSATIGKALRARTLRPGDQYRYGGMTRRVRRLLSARHLAPALRAAYPIVCDEKGVLWVPGFGVREGESTAGKCVYAYFSYGKYESAE